MNADHPNHPPNTTSPYTQELPVDVPMKQEVTQNRWGLFVMVGGMGIMIVVLFLVSVNLGFVISNSL